MKFTYVDTEYMCIGDVWYSRPENDKGTYTLVPTELQSQIQEMSEGCAGNERSSPKPKDEMTKEDTNDWMMRVTYSTYRLEHSCADDPIYLKFILNSMGKWLQERAERVDTCQLDDDSLSNRHEEHWEEYENDSEVEEPHFMKVDLPKLPNMEEK